MGKIVAHKNTGLFILFIKKQGNMARKSPAEKSTPFGQRQTFFKYLFNRAFLYQDSFFSRRFVANIRISTNIWICTNIRIFTKFGFLIQRSGFTVRKFTKLVFVPRSGYPVKSQY